MTSRFLRRLFWLLNRAFMVPAFRLGLGEFMGNPLTGYIMVVKTRGRKTGRTRYTPVNYAIIDGHIYCLAGWGRIAHWFRNLRATPRVEVLLPGRALEGTAEEVTDPQESARALRQVLKNGGFAGFLLGFNPWSAPEAVLHEKARGIPVIRIRATGVGTGAGDPGGWLWILVAAVVAWLIWRGR